MKVCVSRQGTEGSLRKTQPDSLASSRRDSGMRLWDIGQEGEAVDEQIEEELDEIQQEVHVVDEPLLDLEEKRGRLKGYSVTVSNKGILRPLLLFYAQT